MKRVIITGATGFVGANLAGRLIQEGHKVYLLVRNEHQNWRIENLLPHPRLIRVDMLDQKNLFHEIERIHPDWIFHLATYGAYSWQEDLRQAIDTNFLGTVNLLEACREIGFEAFINTGSSSEYGVKDHAPTEDEYLEPNSYYAVSKASATLFCRYTAQRFQLPIYTLRLYSVYGPYEEPKRLIPTLILKGLQGVLPPLVHPNIVRDLIYIDDVINAYMFVASSANVLPWGDIYNIGTGKQITLREIVDITKELFKIQKDPEWGSMENRSWDTYNWVANHEKLSSAGWIPNYDFRSGYVKTIDWFKQNQDIVDRVYFL